VCGTRDFAVAKDCDALHASQIGAATDSTREVRAGAHHPLAMTTRDRFEAVLGNERGSQNARVADLGPFAAARARALVEQLAAETPDQDSPRPDLLAAVERCAQAHELSARVLATRSVADGAVIVWELHGRFSSAQECHFSAVLVWRAAGRWELFEHAPAPGR
jgi:hypothetical protein